MPCLPGSQCYLLPLELAFNTRSCVLGPRRICTNHQTNPTWNQGLGTSTRWCFRSPGSYPKCVSHSLCQCGTSPPPKALGHPVGTHLPLLSSPLTHALCHLGVWLSPSPLGLLCHPFPSPCPPLSWGSLLFPTYPFSPISFPSLFRATHWGPQLPFPPSPLPLAPH